MQRFARDTSDPAKRRGTMNTTESLCDLEPERSEVQKSAPTPFSGGTVILNLLLATSIFVCVSVLAVPGK